MKKLLRKIEIMVLLFAVCFVGSMYVSKNMCCDVINRDMGYMFNIMYDKSANGNYIHDVISQHVISQLEQNFFLNK